MEKKPNSNAAFEALRQLGNQNKASTRPVNKSIASDKRPVQRDNRLSK